MIRNLTFDETYPYPIERVWLALTDSTAIADWLMPNDFKPEIGHKFQFHTDPAPGFDGTVDCEVIELTPPNRLAFSWKGGGIDTIATFSLSAVPEGTHLRLEHTGFSGLRGMMVSSILGGGWKKILGIALPKAVSRVSDAGYQPLSDTNKP
ncbi:MAG TPA: SRPBCC domain-containing protein [Chthoniobacterales bacterium]|jgi:uncharacterized protein YndB with AHSA1/START domain